MTLDFVKLSLENNFSPKLRFVTSLITHYQKLG